MLIHRAYKTELDPSNEQRGIFERYAGTARYVYNRALAQRIEEYEKKKADKKHKMTTFFAQSRELTEAKKDGLAWMFEVSRSVQEESLRDLDKAYQNFFRRVKNGERPGFPRFKSRHRSRKKFKLKGSIKAEAKRIKLPTIGWIRLKEKLYIPLKGVKILSATVSENAGRWFVSVAVETEIPDPVQGNGEVIGVDVGIKSLAVCSDGTVYENPKQLEKMRKKLKRLQCKQARQRSRCPECNSPSIKFKKGGWCECCKCGNKYRIGEPSNRSLKTKDKIMKLHKRIADARSSIQHQATTDIIKKDASVIVIEDLNVKGMMSAGGRRKRGLNRNLADAAMGEIHRQLKYKAEWNGIDILEAPRFFPSSKTCNACGFVNDVLTLQERNWTCESCGSVNERDFNASLNLRDLADKSTGMSPESKARGESISPDCSFKKSGNSRRNEKPVSRKSRSKTGRGISNDAAHTKSSCTVPEVAV